MQKQEQKLNQIAEQMKTMMTNNPRQAFVHWKLGHGLELVLQRLEDRRFRLALAREAVVPSDTEVVVCQKAFGVPTGTDWASTSKYRKSDKTGRSSVWHVCEMTWTETAPTSMVG